MTMTKQLKLLHSLHAQVASELWETDRKLFRHLQNEMHDYSQLGEVWSLSPLQFYFFRGDL